MGVVKSELKNLSRLVKMKESEYELEKMSRVQRQPSPPVIMPIPMFMPQFNPIGGFQMGCSCSCNCSCRCNKSRIRRETRNTRKYRHLVTENCGVGTEEVETSPIKQIPFAERVN